MSRPLAVCTYCGKTREKTKDHVPPRLFLPSKKPNQLWTVPCCRECNEKHGENDVEAWVKITCLDRTEKNPVVSQELQPKAMRLMSRNYKLLGAVAEDIHFKEEFSKGGIYLRDRAAIDLNKPCVNDFLNRMTRALVWRFNKQCGLKCDIEWTLEETEKEFVEKLGEPHRGGKLGDSFFSYGGWYYKNKAVHFIRFYLGEVFITYLEMRPGEGLIDR